MKQKKYIGIILLTIAIVNSACSKEEAYFKEPVDDLGDPIDNAIEESDEIKDLPSLDIGPEVVEVPTDNAIVFEKNGISLAFSESMSDQIKRLSTQRVETSLNKFTEVPMTFPPVDTNGDLTSLKLNVDLMNKKSSDPAKVAIWNILKINYGENKDLSEDPSESELRKYIFKNSNVYVDKENKQIVVETLVGTKRLSVGERFIEEDFVVDIKENIAAKDLPNYYKGNSLEIEFFAVGIDDSNPKSPKIDDINKFKVRLEEKFVEENLIFDKHKDELTLVGVKDGIDLNSFNVIDILNSLDQKNGGKYKVVSIADGALKDLDLKGDITNLNISIENIGDEAMSNTSLSGSLPYFPELIRIGKDILKDTPVIKNNKYEGLVLKSGEEGFIDGNKRWLKTNGDI